MVHLFYGPSRKLSALPILLFVVGWGLYLIGFIKRMIKPSLLLPRWDNYPAIVAVGAGPVFVVAALLQACLGGTASASVGSVTAVAAVVFLVSLGNSTITSADTLYQYNTSLPLYNTTNEALAQFYLSSTLAGSILCGMGITLLLLLWGWYQDSPVQDERLHLLRGAANRGTVVRRGFRPNTLFSGCARKLAIPCILLAFVGWCVLVAGHHHRINSIPQAQEGHYSNDVLIFDFGQWGACVLTPLLLLFGLLHAGASGSASALMGVVNAVLNGLVLTSIGYYMIHDVGQWLKYECESKCDYTVPQNAAALCELVGSFLVCFFWSSTLALWPFYTRWVDEGRGVYQLEGEGGQRMTNSQDYQQLKDEDGIKL
jgi:hypothetical protein